MMIIAGVLVTLNYLMYNKLKDSKMVDPDTSESKNFVIANEKEII